MQPAIDMKRKLEAAFPKKQAVILAEVITDAYSELVKTSDFNELKGIVKELAEAQKELTQAQNRTNVFAELEDRVEAVRQEYGKEEIVRILVTHYATKGFMKKAQDRSVLVVQSFEW